MPDDFRNLVRSNADWFAGVHPETEHSLAEMERRLGLALPNSLKWLLSTCGYSAACGVANLGESVDDTLRYRQTIGLPARYLVLNDYGDAGVVLLDLMAHDGRVLWLGNHNLPRLGEGAPLDEDCDLFDDFGAWVRFNLQAATEEAEK